MLPPFDPWLSTSVAGDVLRASHAKPHALAARQATRLAALWQAASATRLYAPLLKGKAPTVASLQQLPVMHKAYLMERFDDWVADPALKLDDLRRFVADPSRIGQPFAGRYTVWESSGSTGEPAIFVQDSRAMAVHDALEALRHPRRPLPMLQRWLDPCHLGERMVFLGATTGHFASMVSIERLRRLNPLLRRVQSLSFLQPCKLIVEQLNRLQPTVLATYPSAAVMLANERLAGRLKAAPREIWCGGETLTPSMRLHVEQVFGCCVINSYGASEFLTLGADCASGRLHLNTDWVLLEPLDDTTLVTNLANHVQPLIRYDLGDRVRFADKPCECGSSLPVIEVEGRCDDMLVIGRKPDRVHLLPLALCTVLEEEAGLFVFQLRQQGPRDLLLSVPCSGRASEDQLARGRTVLAEFLSRHGAGGVRIQCRGGVAGVQGRSGKVQRVVALPS